MTVKFLILFIYLFIYFSEGGAGFPTVVVVLAVIMLLIAVFLLLFLGKSNYHTRIAPDEVLFSNKN